MTSSVLLGLLIAGITVIYWKLCRKRALAVQERAVDLLVDFYADETVADSEKASVHANYLLTQRWWYLPLLVVAVPITMLFSFIFDRPGLSKAVTLSEKHRKVMDCLVMIYFVRNPILASLCMSAIILMMIPVLLIGVLLNRIKSLPSFAMLATLGSIKFVANAIKQPKEAHSH